MKLRGSFSDYLQIFSSAQWHLSLSEESTISNCFIALSKDLVSGIVCLYFSPPHTILITGKQIVVKSQNSLFYFAGNMAEFNIFFLKKNKGSE